MSDTDPWTFFYGSYLNLDVLAGIGITPSAWKKARLDGFDIRIAPRANVVASPGDSVFGIVARVSHDDLERLYRHAEDVLGEAYNPFAVLVQTMDGEAMPALCYISSTMTARPASNEYIDRIAAPARSYEFPDAYLKRVESFRPVSAQG